MAGLRPGHDTRFDRECSGDAEPGSVTGEIWTISLASAYTLCMIGLLVGAIALAVCWRGAPPMARAQLKWLAFDRSRRGT